MSDYVVIEHIHDTGEGVYRLVLGYKVEHEVPVYEDDGVTPKRYPGTVATDPDTGEPLKDADGNEIVDLGEPMMETREEFMAVEDFVFAADDERWKGQSKEDVAAAQRAIVKEALDARQAAAEKAEAERAAAQSAMPGAGEAL